MALNDMITSKEFFFGGGGASTRCPIMASLYGYAITLGSTPLDELSADVETSTSQHTIITWDIRPCCRRDSKPQAQQVSGRTPTPYTARPPVSAIVHELERTFMDVAMRYSILVLKGWSKITNISEFKSDQHSSPGTSNFERGLILRPFGAQSTSRLSMFRLGSCATARSQYTSKFDLNEFASVLKTYCLKSC